MKERVKKPLGPPLLPLFGKDFQSAGVTLPPTLRPVHS